ncbi:MFS transporter [Nocardia yunnanensis]|uniref:MFS transporter n=1 Tax=Nocardia yunnanensis TaxID=2382165 RepID=UPI0024824FE8|nr:MFS transporter [Nocardia yunnanensis]
MAILREPDFAGQVRVKFDYGYFARNLYFNPKKAPDFAWYLISIFWASVGIGVVITFLVYFLQFELKLDENSLVSMVFKATLIINGTASVVSPLGGTLADRLGRRKPIVAAGALLASAGYAVMDAIVNSSGFLSGCVILSVSAMVCYSARRWHWRRRP